MDNLNWKKEWVDYYHFLGIDRNAEQDEIKKAYRNLMKEYHPDLHPDDDSAAEMSRKINDAYEVLSNESTKKEYDNAWDDIKSGKKSAESYYEENTAYADSGNNNETDPFEGYEDVSYEDVKNNYTEEERRFAEKMVLKGIIEEELEKIKNIIRTKNELLGASYKGELDQESYYSCLKELVEISNEFSKNLHVLSEKACSFGMMQELEIIAENIRYLDEQIQNMPQSVDEVKWTFEKELFALQLKKELEKLLEEASNKKAEVLSLLIAVYNKDISYLDYTTYAEMLGLECIDVVSRLEELCKMSLDVRLDPDIYLKATSSVAELNTISMSIPKDASYAADLGKVAYITSQVSEILSNNDSFVKEIEDLRKEMDHEIDLDRVDEIYKQINKLIEEQKNKIEFLYKQLVELNVISPADNLRKMCDEAIDIYNRSKEDEKHLHYIFGMLTTYHDVEIIEVVKNALFNWDRLGAIENLIKATELLKMNPDGANLLNHLNSGQIDKSRKDLKGQIKNLNILKENVEEKYKLSKNSPYKSIENLKIANYDLSEQIKSNVVCAIVIGGLTIAALYASIKSFFGKEQHMVWGTVSGGLTIVGVSAVVECISNIKHLNQEKKDLKKEFNRVQAQKLKNKTKTP